MREVTASGILRWRLAGLAGALAMAVAATAVGDLPGTAELGSWPRLFWPPGLPWPATLLAYGGLTLLGGAWWELNGAVAQRPDRLRIVLQTVPLWAVPLLMAPPLQSRDVYSYLAQGEMLTQGIDPYRSGPAALGGPLAANVSPMWQHAAAPYGPVFLAVAAAVMAVASSHIVLAVIGMRLAMVAALAGTAACTVALARRCRVDPADAVWLAILNPLTLVHIVSGAHNDILFVALMSAGVLLAVRDRPFSAAVVIGLAVLVKAPAGLALMVIVPAAARRLSGRWARARGAAAVAVVAATTVLAVTWVLGTVMGTGYGWLAALNNTARVRNGLSLTTDLGMALDGVGRLLGPGGGGSAVPVVRAVGLVVAAAMIPVLLLRHRGRPLAGLGLVLTVLVLLGPVVHPWYVLWGLVPLAASVPDPRLRRVAAWGSIGLALFPMPWGEAFTSDLPLTLGGGTALGLAVMAILAGSLARRERAGDEQRSHARSAAVRTR